MATYGNAEAVVFDQRPFLAEMQLRRQQKLLEEKAINERIESDLAKINTKGIRDVDTPDILSQYSRIKDMGITHRDAIRNPAKNPKAYAEYRDAWAKINNDIAKSQAAKERTKEFYDFYSKNRDKIDTNSFNTVISDVNAPLNTANYIRSKDKNINDILFNEQQFDQGKWTNSILSAAPGKLVVSPQRLANGQYKNNRTFERDPHALGVAAAATYDSNYEGAEKFFNKQFLKLDPEDKATYEQYVQQYDPEFKIQTPKDLAVATALFGRVKQDQGYVVSGTDQVFAKEQQQRSFEQRKQLLAMHENNIRTRPKKDAGDKFLVDEISKNLSTGDIDKAIQPFISYQSPGATTAFFSKNRQNDGMRQRMLSQLKTDGVDAVTRMLTKKDIDDGVLIVAIPKVNPETKEDIPGQYKYMAVKSNEKRNQSRINAVLNYARGSGGKVLPDKYYTNSTDDTEENTALQILDEPLSEGSLEP